MALPSTTVAIVIITQLRNEVTMIINFFSELKSDSEPRLRRSLEQHSKQSLCKYLLKFPYFYRPIIDFNEKSIKNKTSRGCY